MKKIGRENENRKMNLPENGDEWEKIVELKMLVYTWCILIKEK